MPYRLICLVLALCPLPSAGARGGGPTSQARQKLYVTNSAGNDVTVIDAATHQPIGRIEVGPHPHGIAVPASQKFILVTIEGKSPGELVWIDPTQDRIVRRMNIGPAPNQLAVTPDGKFAYIPTSRGYWEVVDLDKARIVKRIVTGGRPHNTVCSPDGKRMYLAPMGNPKKVTIVDVGTHEAIGVIPFSNVVRPIALGQDGKRLYAEVDDLVGIEVADVDARKMVYRVPAELSEENQASPSRSHGLGIRPDQREVWECDVEHHEVHVYDVTSEKPRQISTIPIGSRIYWLTFRPDGKICYVSARGANSVVAIDTETKKIVARMPAGKEPKRLIVVTHPGE